MRKVIPSQATSKMRVLFLIMILRHWEHTATRGLEQTEDSAFLGSNPSLLGGCMCDIRKNNTSANHVTSVLHLMKVLRWNRTIIFVDCLQSNELRTILPRLGLTSVFGLCDLYNIGEVKKLLSKLHKKFLRRLHFLIFSNYSRAMDLLQIADHFDMESNRTTDFRHHSFWVIVCYSQCEVRTSLLPYIHHLENVVLIPSERHGCPYLWHLVTTPGGRSFSAGNEIGGMKEQQDIFLNTKYKLNNRTLIVSILEQQPYSTQNENGFEGYFIDVLDSVSATLNFSYEIVHPNDMGWGVLKDGNWDGLVGQLERREVDLVIATLTTHPDREKVMDFLYPAILTQFDDFMYRLPETTISWLIYLQPFKPLVLLILLITMLVSTVAVYVINRCNEGSTRRFSMAYSFFLMLGMFLCRGLGCKSRAQSTRLLLFTWGVFSVIIASCYSATLVAFLADPKPVLPFTNLGELVRQKEYKWGFISGDIREHIFNRSTSGDMKLVWDGVCKFVKTDPGVLSRNLSVHLAKVHAEKYAFLQNRYMIEKDRGHDCTIRFVGQNIIWHQFGISVPTDYPLSREIEDTLADIAASGLLDIWWRRWSEIKVDQCIEQGTVDTLTLSDVATPFYLLFVGIGTAGFALVMEIIAYKHQTCR